MEVLISAIAVLAALIGHAAIWVGFVNRIHGTGAPRHFIVKGISAIGHMGLVLAPPAAAWYLWRASRTTAGWTSAIDSPGPIWLYLVACWVLAPIVATLWIARHWLRRPPAQLLAKTTTLIDTASSLDTKPLHGFRANLLSLVPGNQVLQIAVEELEVKIARLPPALDGFSIVQITDWHITGRIGLEYFRQVVSRANDLAPDLVALCGDLIEDINHFDWIPETFAKLRARHGVYYVLGNHDLYTRDVPHLRGLLAAAGVVDLGGCWKRIEARGEEIILAGNELPWFSPPANMTSSPPRSSSHEQLRILVSHSPDQFTWAQRHDFDLMLAGHTHGGQIRLPVIGPIFSPSLHGVKYASGTFFAEPTLMHVSRGISAELPIRLNCPPELTKLVLRKGDSRPTQNSN